MLEAILHILFVGVLITGVQIIGGYTLASIIINKEKKCLKK